MCAIPFVGTNNPQYLRALWLCCNHHPSLSAWAFPASPSIPVTLCTKWLFSSRQQSFCLHCKISLPVQCCASYGSSVHCEKCNAVHCDNSFRNIVSSLLMLSDIHICSNWVMCLAASLCIATTKQTHKIETAILLHEPCNITLPGIKILHSYLGT